MADPRDGLKTALADRYAIERELGRGGMATVYLAEDLKHHRPVAVKVLDPELARAVGAERFLREVEITAKLNHPHILPLLDSGCAEDQTAQPPIRQSAFLYYVMPYVEGESLRDRLTREHQLPLDDALEITKEVADALGYAHSLGLVHRDIKPENILFQAGHAVVSDFGIARAVTAAGGEQLTETGLAIGTPAYMSPEQASGNKDVDARSDLYSLGCVLYEMLSGDVPFVASTPQAVIAKKLSEPLPRISVVREAVPPAIEAVLGKALARNAADRYTTAQQFAEALSPERISAAARPEPAKRRWHRGRVVVYGGAVVLGLATIAAVASLWPSKGPQLSEDVVVVLPFANETGDAKYDVVGRMVASEITNRIDGAGVARAAPASEVAPSWKAAVGRRASEPGYDPRAAVAAAFGAGTVVSGSVFPQRDSLRFVAEISRARGATLVQSLAPVVVAADRIEEGIETVREGVAAALRMHLDLGAWSDSLALTPPPSLAVYEAYNSAATAASSQERQRQLERALALDPTYLPAKTELALVHYWLENFPTADSLLKEAAEFHDQMAPDVKYQWDWLRATLDGDREAAYRAGREAARRIPSPAAFVSLGWEAINTNRPREALEAVSGVDPDSPGMTDGYRRRLGWVLYSALHMLGDHRRELREIGKLRARYPDYDGFFTAEIQARAALGDVRQVTELVEQAIRTERSPVDACQVAALELQAHGHPEAAPAIAERGLAYLQQRPAQVQGTAPHRYQLSVMLSMLERWDEAYAIAEALVQEQPSKVSYLTLLGTLAARRGQRDEALAIAERLAAMDIPYDRGNLTYARARIAAVLGEKEEAVALLEQAHQEGWTYSRVLHMDQNLQLLRGYPPFEAFLRPKG